MFFFLLRQAVVTILLYLWCYLKYLSPQEKKYLHTFSSFPLLSPSLILQLRNCLQKYWDHRLIRLLIWIF